METTEFKINIPEGYEIDKENSTLECIKFKQKDKVNIWSQIPNLNGAYVNWYSQIVNIDTGPVNTTPDNRFIFSDEKHAKSALAIAQISQLMPYYGGSVTAEEWNNPSTPKYCIEKHFNNICSVTIYGTYTFLAFHTYEQRDKFMSYPENIQLVKDYLMIS
jgi:hypothetical protein